MLKKHSIEQCYVRIEINPQFTKMQKDGRRCSKRIQSMKNVAGSSIAVGISQSRYSTKRSNSPLSTVSLAGTRKIPPKRRASVELSIPNRDKMPKKSILVKDSIRLRQRSKSVSFEPSILCELFEADDAQKPSISKKSAGTSKPAYQQPQIAHQSSIAQHSLYASVSPQTTPIDLTNKARSNSDISTVDIRSYERRIAGLIDSNNAKTGRIKSLQDERSSLLEQIEKLHHINRRSAETVDTIRMSDQNAPPVEDDVVNGLRSEIDRLTAENVVLKKRIERLNNANFCISGEHNSLRGVIQPYSNKVLPKRNYNLNN